MKNKVIAMAMMLLSGHLAFSQTTFNTNIASNWNNWRVQGSQNLLAGSNPNVPFSACLVQGDNQHLIPAFTAGVPIKIVDPGNPSIDEVITPTNIIPGANCTATLAPTNAHPVPYYIVSGTFGLQEAVTYSSPSAGLNVTNLNYNWHLAGGGAATIFATTGNINMAFVDVSVAPNVTYRWNTSTSHYVPNFAVLGIANPTAAAGAAAGTGATAVNNTSSSGNIMTLTLTTGTSPTTGTLFTETVGTASAAGNINCPNVQSVGANNFPVPITITSTASVITATVAVAPTASTVYILNLSCE